MTINVLFYREETGEGEYARIWREPAPIVTETDKLSYTEKDVAYHKTRAERSLNSWKSRDGETASSIETVARTITDPPEDEVPF